MYEMLYGESRFFYDPIVLKVFASVIKPLPIGAKLRLADGRYAVVVRHNTQDPFNPQVIIAYDVNGNSLSKKTLVGPFHLKANQDVKVESFREEDVSFLNGAPEVPWEKSMATPANL